jgi:multicomponent Na+:H+ antiporter subunit E
MFWKAAKRFTLFLVLWLAITANDPSAWVTGAFAAAAATFVSLSLLPPATRQVHLFALLRLAPGFAWASFLGGLDVAWRALHPKMPMQPRWIDYAVRLPAGAARVSLGNELSLMPGTLAAGCRGDTLYIHCLDGSQSIEAQVALEESRIAESIGVTLKDTHG